MPSWKDICATRHEAVLKIQQETGEDNRQARKILQRRNGERPKYTKKEN